MINASCRGPAKPGLKLTVAEQVVAAETVQLELAMLYSTPSARVTNGIEPPDVTSVLVIVRLTGAAPTTTWPKFCPFGIEPPACAEATKLQEQLAKITIADRANKFIKCFREGHFARTFAFGISRQEL
jgi:hypothetical protein